MWSCKAALDSVPYPYTNSLVTSRLALNKQEDTSFPSVNKMVIILIPVESFLNAKIKYLKIQDSF